ncbi:MAG: transferase [Desulfobacula sp.]|jgi:carbonic anhydrase/acetyltransferase-like protein (isoleucine patch superfamily)|uniref:transferase n=1 Tax=Desulfobacula sp. TaxID=2593537 RepID=UPI001DCABE85|nr:transferase [Desulfobacula sp.]MBT3485915.1 transferase [Desulfobacula sp.]MBT3805440.1 transferase [Desulfobacula sp.]MBT4025991.1 transferase [Desulfobacula sp.]MBT4199090.1 transferase [Desulfobacula sp.]
MDQLKQLNDRIIRRVNVNLEEFDFNTENFVNNSLEYDKMLDFYAFYGITSKHPIYFHFKNSNIAGSYFLGKCYVGRSAIYKSDVRGDELKRKGDTIRYKKDIPLVEDEMITIRDSLLYKTLVHSNSHNLESPEQFGIHNTISAHYANIHGTTLEGCFLGPFASVDLMNLHSCIVGEFSYVQAGELFHRKIDPGTVWVRSQNFEFKYKFKNEILDNFVGVNDSYQPRGIIYDFVKEREQDYEKLFDVVNLTPIDAPSSSAVNRYAVILGKTRIGKNVLVSQRAFLDNAIMGDGSNAQENTYIIHSNLSGLCITAHGGKIIHADIGLETFVGFNSFLNGKFNARIKIGEGCIIMPHTIIDPAVPIEIPDEHLVWGFIGSEEDVRNQTILLDDLAEIRDTLRMGKMVFTGNGSVFIDAFRKRISQILLANGALFNNGEKRGHAQDDQNISFNTIQPYRTGERKGLYPSIRIKP